MQIFWLNYLLMRARKFYISKKILFERRYDEPLSIYFKRGWNDHLVNYFPLMYYYGIDTSILHLTSCRAEF